MICVKQGLGAYLGGVCDPAEALWVTIPSNNLNCTSNSNLHIACTYIPGDTKTQPRDIEIILNLATEITTKYDNDYFLLLGDFNLPCITWSGEIPTFLKRGPVEVQKAAISLTNTLGILGLSQHSNIRNSSDNTLDLVFSNFPLELHTSSDNPLIMEDVFHPSLLLEATDISSTPLQSNVIIKHKFFKGDYISIIKYLNDIPWREILSTESVDKDVQILYDHLYKCIDEFVPKVSTYKPNTYPVWYTSALLRIIKEKSKAHARWKRFKNRLDYNEFALLRKRQRKIEVECKNKYIREMEINIKKNSKCFYKKYAK